MCEPVDIINIWCCTSFMGSWGQDCNLSFVWPHFEWKHTLCWLIVIRKERPPSHLLPNNSQRLWADKLSIRQQVSGACSFPHSLHFNARTYTPVLLRTHMWSSSDLMCGWISTVSIVFYNLIPHINYNHCFFNRKHNSLMQGCPKLVLEGRCPSEFRWNFPQHTCLKVCSTVPSKTLISWIMCVGLGLEQGSVETPAIQEQDWTPLV